MQLGAGGAGAAVAHALLTLGADRITLVDVQPDRAGSLATELTARFGAGRALAATADELAGLLPTRTAWSTSRPPGWRRIPVCRCPARLLHPALWVADVVYRPLETELLRQARALGCRTLDGGGMVVFQAAHAFRLFTGREPDAERMLTHLTDLVSA